jgi:hypothetical protein
MNAIDLLTRQHRQMEAATKALLDGDERVRRTGFAEAADHLMAHVLSEEIHFYPAVSARRTEDVLLESLEEHLSLKRVLADLLVLEPGDVHFEPKLHVLEEQMRHHHEEEEENLFPKASKLLSKDELEALGERMGAEQSTLLEGRPGLRAKHQTEEAAPLSREP